MIYTADDTLKLRIQGAAMQVLSSLKEARKRHRSCQVVRRRGRLYVICKANPRFKALQGGARNKH